MFRNILVFFKRLKIRFLIIRDGEVGKAINYYGKEDLEIEKKIHNVLKKTAIQLMPKNYYIEIVRKIPMDFGRARGLAWYWYKDIPNELQNKPDSDFKVGFGRQILERFLNT